MKKQVIGVVFVLMLGAFCGQTFGVATWGDYTADHDWANGGNWANATTAPTDEAQIRGDAWAGGSAGYEFPVISSAVANIGIVRCGGNGYGGTAEMTIVAGGSLTVNTFIRVGSYETVLSSPVVKGVLNMQGGNLIVNGYFDIGHARSDGLIEMTGGTITVNKLNLPGSTATNEGLINLKGGLVDVGAGGLNFANNLNDYTPPYAGMINIEGTGTLRVLGSIAATSFSRGYIVGYNGTEDLNIDITSDPGYTIVTAVPEPATLLILGLGGLLIRKKR